MKLFKSLVIAFSMYSRVPMPQFEWKEEDMQYSLCFFPLVGTLIGGLLAGFLFLSVRWNLGWLSSCLMGCAIPLLVTGGFHLDGFMDVSDALHSYGDREKKMEILKDSHIGAFAVIQTLVLSLIYVSAFSEIDGIRPMLVFCMGFTLSRILSGLSLVYLKSAKREGLLFAFSNTANKTVVRVVLWIELVVTIAGMLYLEVICGSLAVACAVGCFCYYDYKSKKELGGITGDFAGFFVVICEAAMAIACAAGSKIPM